MSGLILSTDYVTYTPTARSADGNYPIINITDKKHMVRRFKAADATANDWLIKLDFGAATTIKAILIRYVNFTSITIQGHATDSWASPSFTETVTISKDEITNRYQLLHLFTTFNYRYMRIFIPTGQTPTSDTVWFVGDVCCFSDYDELTYNITSYNRTASIPYKDLELHGKPVDRVKLGDHLQFECEIGFGERVYTEEGELFEINHLDCSTPTLFFENLGENTKGYLCYRNAFYQGSRSGNVKSSGSTISFSEVGV